MRKWQIVPALLGLTAAGLVAQPATALTLNLVQSGVASDPPPVGFTPDLRLFESEWRAGVGGPGDYEAAIGPNGANYPLAGTFDIDWKNGQSVVWDLQYTSSNGISQLTMNGKTVTYDSPQAGFFKNLALVAKVQDRDDGLVAPGTSIGIQITDVNGCGPSCDFSNTSTSALFDTQLTQANYFSSDTTITSLVGKVVISWTTQDPQPPGKGARSSVAVQLKGFDPSSSIDPQSTIPEPSSILGLLAVGAFGTLFRIKSK